MKVHNLQGKELEVLALDFETYYDKAFSLRKLTTTEYVRDPRFQVHGCSFIRKENPFWLSGPSLSCYLNGVDWANTAVLAHNCAFDAFILTQYFGHTPAYYLDTLSMSKGEFGVGCLHRLNDLSERLGNGTKIAGTLESTEGVKELTLELEEQLSLYAMQDVQLLWDNFHKLYFERNYPTAELHIIDLTIRCFVEPKLIVDHDLCRQEIDAEMQKKSQLVALAGVSTTQLSSNQQFAELLRQRGVEPPRKISLTTGKSTFAFSKTDPDFLALELDERVTTLVQARRAVKSSISETRAHRLIANSRPTLPVMLNYCGAITHRWSGGDKLNLQNIPGGRKGQSDLLRQAIQAPKGWRFCRTDSSQVECRTAAWIAGEEPLLEVFRNNGDPYIELASEIYGYPINKHDHPEERAVGKAGELSLQFGVGVDKFVKSVQVGQSGPAIPDFSYELGQRAVQIYRAKRTAIVAAWKRLGQILAAMPSMGLNDSITFGPNGLYRMEADRIMMPNELFIQYPNLQGTDNGAGRVEFFFNTRDGVNYIYPAMLFQHLVQSTARSIVAAQILAIAREIPDIVMLVHDECDFLVREEDADAAIQFAVNCFRQPPSWCSDLPLDAEGSHSQSYAK
ncbi:DNA polymerase [Chromatium okenii]|jgi:DNA polymerase|uniref:DNA polymerase n=1 Tax=Chromatium okenii TaxID=61644 RepID=UPI0026F27E14|nr:DNA polymerase [Chromatium okenii]MBV5310910.1 hypothetical protein [Chromatium okenii]